MPFNIAVFILYSLVFTVNLMILAKNCNFRPPIPLRFGSEKIYKKASYETNKHNFFGFSPSKVLYYYVYSWVGI